jgi:hypothetical protein
VSAGRAAPLPEDRPLGRDRLLRNGWPWLVPPVAVGAFLRLFRLGPQLLLYDELHAPRTVVELDLAEILTSYLPSDNSIPLTALYELLVEWGVALSELHLRLPAIVAGLLALVVVPVALWRRLGPQAAIAAAWLVAISPGLVFYSRLARSYMPVVLLVFVAAMAFERWWRTGSWRSGVGYVVAAAAAAWFHLGAGPVVAAPFLWAAGAKALRPRSGRSLLAIALLGLGLAAGFAAFLLPAWESFTALLAEKSGADLPRLGVAVQVLFLQAGAAEAFAAVLFWAAAAVGLAVLLRRRPAFASFTLVLVAAHLAALLVTAPFGVENPVILNRYLLVGLPFLLAWAAVGLADGWRAATGAASPLARRAARVAVAAAVPLLVAGGPLADRRLLHSTFLTHDDFVGFATPPPAMASPDLVPAFYRRLAALPGDGAVIEAPSLPTWVWHTHLRIYQDLHRRRVLLAPAELALFEDELDLANYVEPRPAALLAAPARWLVLHRKSAWELDRVALADTVGLPLSPAMRQISRHMARRMAGHLRRHWGPPDLADEVLLVWDLDRVRRFQGGARGVAGARRAPRHACAPASCDHRPGTGVGELAVLGDPSAAAGEPRAAAQAGAVQVPGGESAHRLHGVAGGGAERDAARLGEVARRHRHVAQPQPEVDRLHQELRVEDEVVAVGLEGHRLEHAPAVGAKAAVPVAEVLPGEQVLDQRQPAVGQVLDPRHAAGQRLSSRADAVAEHHVADVEVEDGQRRRQDPRVVLVVGVEHDHVVGAAGERLAVAGLLVAAIAQVPRVDDDVDPQAAGDGDGVVAAAVVDHHHLVEPPARQLADYPLEGGGGVVRRHHDDSLAGDAALSAGLLSHGAGRYHRAQTCRTWCLGLGSLGLKVQDRRDASARSVDRPKVVDANGLAVEHRWLKDPRCDGGCDE